MTNKDWKTYKSEIEKRVNSLLKNNFYFEIIFLFGNILEAELKHLIDEHQKACRYILDHWKKNGMDLTSKNFVHQTTGPTILKHALMTYLDEPTSMRASDLYKKYIVDKNLRKKLHARGVYLLSKVFYNGFASVHLVGSTNFKEGYVSWAEEVNALQSHQRDLGVYK